MATLILGSIGRIVAGPIGAIVGTLAGSTVDRTMLGGGRPREQGRISNPAVQSATYGEPIPLIVGRMRAAGNLIWTSGIREAANTSGGGKRSGPATTTYSYSASFAVALAGRRIIGVERIWADGKLIRDSDENFATPITMRLHKGEADQAVDPLIAAAEGVTATPAYRGIAYAVFEDLPLGDYGNRIPNLTFEIVADADTVTVGEVIGRLASAAGNRPLPVIGAFPAVTGYIAGRAGSLADVLTPLLAIADAAIIDGDGPSQGLRIEGHGGVATPIAADAIDARRPADDRPPERLRRAAADSQPAALELAFYDASRDYQPGLQRARRAAAGRVEQQSIAAAMDPVQAKTLAVDLLTAGQASRVQRRLRLAWRHHGIGPGALVTLPDAGGIWRVREARFENFIVHLELERRVTPTPTAPASSLRMADGGRLLQSECQAAGPTTLHVLDLPPLPGELPTTPRLWIAGSGAASAWCRAGIVFSTDAGESFSSLGSMEGGTVIGTALTALPDASALGWDPHSSVEIELLTDRDWLEPRSAAAVLAGANLALLGDELIQFCGADALGPRRFRLHGLLRGRRGTEAATVAHAVGDRFVIVDPARMLLLELPLEMLGRSGLVRAVGNGDSVESDVSFRADGSALRPLSPTQLRARWRSGDLHVEWVRRSRGGFGWSDFVDAPLSEGLESYQIEVALDGRSVRRLALSTSHYVYSYVDRLADGDSSIITIKVTQWSASVGPGAAAAITVNV